MAARPQVTVYNKNGEDTKRSAELPAVFTAPIRPDVVRFVHTNVRKNARQPYGVKVHFGPMGKVAGMQHSAHSWGTGRAVARIPRVSASGTHRAGQGAYGNMCRGGRMFNPTRTWRKWHKKISKGQRRYALASALAASAVPALVMARGHRIDDVAEIPFVVEDDLFNDSANTKASINGLAQLGIDAELKRASERQMRAGKGKMRGRRRTSKRGPLVIFDGSGDPEKVNNLKRSLRNIRAVDMCDVNAMNLLQLAPGGHVGRFIIWTESAFKRLNEMGASGKLKVPNSFMKSADLARIINSDEIQSVCKPAVKTVVVRKRRNPLKRKTEMMRLDPTKKSKQVD